MFSPNETLRQLLCVSGATAITRLLEPLPGHRRVRLTVNICKANEAHRNYIAEAVLTTSYTGRWHSL